MCGIAGFIGESKKPVLTYQLITKLFEKSESRGIDAAGYWGTEAGEDGQILYHKEPGKSSIFVKKDMWKRVAKHNPNLLLVHARGASKGVGEPHYNVNNHPFTSSDKTIGLVHNGRVDDLEYQSLKQKYEVLSGCDSEILLRIFESGQNYSTRELLDFGEAECPTRLAGIRDIFSLINDGHMAVAVGERREDERYLWMFRNKHRPLWIVDIREALGQIYFVSEPGIWEDAVHECPAIKPIVKAQKLIELPTEEVWFFKIDSQTTCPPGVQRFEVEKTTQEPWVFDGRIFRVQKRPSPYGVVTKLNDNDEIIPKLRKPEPNVVEYDEIPISDLTQKCEDIIYEIKGLRDKALQLIQEASMSKPEFLELMDNLEQQRQDLEGLAAILGR